MSLLGTPTEEEVGKAWENSMKDIINVEKQDDIPELNIYQCGTCAMHSLEEAKEIANDVLNGGIGVMKNEDIVLSDDRLKELGC
jgi:S-ribosylhomocysteine lyase